uniref:Fibronectin type-III domain-containing protein n=1 Tax=Neogobius melanostomus TaxID=47308 RepID=A0A8C6TQ91_9GOBI
IFTMLFRLFLFLTDKFSNQQIKERDRRLSSSFSIKLYPPTNLTVQYRPDSHLWFEWRQIFTHCVESEVRYRVNDEDWESTVASSQEYCINLPSNSSLYELQVRSRVSYSCGQSEEWSDWSQPVLWGNRNLARAPLPDSPMVWHVVLYCVGGATLLLLLVMLLHNESSKGLKEVFKTNHLERTCSVREYCPVSTSDSESSDSSSISVCTDQTNCYGPVPNPDPNDARPYSNAEFVPTEEQHGKHSEVNIVDQ